MSSSDRITQSKGEPKELSLLTRTRQKRKSPSRETKQEMDQHPTGFAEGLDKLQQDTVVHISPLPAQPPRTASSQSITGPIAGERPCSRALSVIADHHKQSQISTNIVSPSARADTPQVPFQKTISKFQVAFVLIICSSIHRRQMQHQH